MKIIETILSLKMQIVLVLLGAFMTIFGITASISYSKPPVYLYDENLPWDTIKNNQHINGDVDFVCGYYEELEDKKTGEAVTRFYLLPDYKEDKFITLRVTSDEFEKYDLQTQKTFDCYSEQISYGEMTLIDIDGRTRKLSKENKEFLTSYLKSVGYSEAEIDDVAVPYMIVQDESDGLVYGIMVAGLVLLTLGILTAAFKIRRIIMENDV